MTPLGLGGQASLQWTNKGIDPADIIVRAIGLGINYLDSANAYGPSQTNYQTAIWRLHLSAADSEYNAALRERLYFATKTGQRYAFNRAQPNAATAISELRQSMTVMFGDGKGWVPDGAYLDAMQMHNVTTDQQVDQIFEGMDDRANLRTRDRIGVLAGLLDYRDGTNYTGLNPEHRHWIRHIGITGHQSSLVLMRALRMDQGNALDTLLVALNANDRNYCSHQYNVIPVAVAKGMGVIAMKAFADGVFYGKAARFSNAPADVVLTVGRPGAVEPADLVRYPLSVPGVGVLITGIGVIDQLAANFDAALTDVASETERRRIEEHGGRPARNRHQLLPGQARADATAGAEGGARRRPADHPMDHGLCGPRSNPLLPDLLGRPPAADDSVPPADHAGAAVGHPAGRRSRRRPLPRHP